jgi:hypothetical protein
MNHPGKAPDLQQFIAEHGGLYSAISAAAWAEWDALNAAWRARRRAYYESLRVTGAQRK